MRVERNIRIMFIHDNEMTCAMNDIEASIVNVLEAAAHKGICFPQEMLNDIEDCIYRCCYKNALWKITKYLDPFDSVDFSLLVESWERLCQYSQQMFDTLTREHLKDLANGGRHGVFAAPLDIPACLENSYLSLKLCEKGKRKALQMQEYRQKQCESAANGSQQARMFKATNQLIIMQVVVRV